MDRNDIRAIISEIRSYYVGTFFRQDTLGRVTLVAPGGHITQEQHDLLCRYRKEISWYLTTPPDETGECWKGHKIEWICSPFGIWLCVCYLGRQYHSPQPQPLTLPQKPQPKYRNHWTQERIAQ